MRRRIAALCLALTALVMGCTTDDTSGVLSPAETVAFLGDNPDAILIDVRTPEEIAEGHLAGALFLDATDPTFVSLAQELDRDSIYVVYCRSGNRSAAAIEVMRELGFTRLYDAGAYTALADAGVPTG